MMFLARYFKQEKLIPVSYIFRQLAGIQLRS